MLDDEVLELFKPSYQSQLREVFKVNEKRLLNGFKVNWLMKYSTTDLLERCFLTLTCGDEYDYYEFIYEEEKCLATIVHSKENEHSMTLKFHILDLEKAEEFFIAFLHTNNFELECIYKKEDL